MVHLQVSGVCHFWSVLKKMFCLVTIESESSSSAFPFLGDHLTRQGRGWAGRAGSCAMSGTKYFFQKFGNLCTTCIHIISHCRVVVKSIFLFVYFIYKPGFKSGSGLYIFSLILSVQHRLSSCSTRSNECAYSCYVLPSFQVLLSYQFGLALKKVLT